MAFLEPSVHDREHVGALHETCEHFASENAMRDITARLAWHTIENISRLFLALLSSRLNLWRVTFDKGAIPCDLAFSHAVNKRDVSRFEDFQCFVKNENKASVIASMLSRCANVFQGQGDIKQLTFSLVAIQIALRSYQQRAASIAQLQRLDDALPTCAIILGLRFAKGSIDFHFNQNPVAFFPRLKFHQDVSFASIDLTVLIARVRTHDAQIGWPRQEILRKLNKVLANG